MIFHLLFCTPYIYTAETAQYTNLSIKGRLNIIEDRMATTTHTSQGAVPIIIQGSPYLHQSPNQLPVPENPKEFPVRKLKVLGSVQIGLGVSLAILSIIGIIVDVISMPRDCDNAYYDMYFDYYYRCTLREEYSSQVFAFDITCLVLSGWYVLTGFLPLCMSRKRESSSGGMRVGFLVCSIIGASIFVPAMFSLGVVGAIQRGEYEKKVVVLSAFMATLSFAELVVSVIGAVYCCCCTPWKKANQSIRVIYTSQPGMLCSLPQSQITMAAQHPNLFYAVEQHGNQVIVQYPTAQQYHGMAANAPVMPQTLFVGTNQALTNVYQQPQVSFDPPSYKE